MDKYDIRPKRRKYKDNPYKLESIEDKKIYRISFNDTLGKRCIVDVDFEIFKALNQFELDDLKELNEFDRHIEHLEQTDELLYTKALLKKEKIEDYIIKKSAYEDLMSAINKLSDIQKRRIKMYYFDEYSNNQIAKLENCTSHSVRISIRKALEELRKILKNKKI